MANEYDGRSYPVHPLGRAGLEGFNPEHDGSHVDRQLGNNNGGFVSARFLTWACAPPKLTTSVVP
jgi:hypothetical protein